MSLSTSGPSSSLPWQRARWALIKTTGFPYELLEQQRDDRLPKLLSGADGTGEPDNAVLAELDQVVKDAAARLLAACRTPRFMEAVLISSPAAHQQLSRWLEKEVDPKRLSSGDKRKLLTLALYLQRFCAKNESTSFFGPVFWASVGEGSGLEVDTGHAGTPHAQVFWSHWAAGELADQMMADPAVAAEVAPYKPAWLFEDESGLRRVLFGDEPNTVETVAPPEPGSLAEQVFARCDGQRSAGSIAVELGITFADLWAALKELRARHLVGFDLLPPIGVLHPVEELRSFTAGLPEGPRERWSAWLNRLERLREDLRSAQGEIDRATAQRAAMAAFEEETGQSAQRAAGVYYADRSIFSEDSIADWRRFAVGGAVDRYLHDELPPVLDLLFELSLARRRARVAAITEWFAETFGSGADLPLDVVLAATAANDFGLGRCLRALDHQARRDGPSQLSDELLRDPTRRRIDLGSEWAQQAAARMDFDTWCVAGVDLFVSAPSTAAATADEFGIVIGEVHGLNDQLLQGPWPDLHPDRGALADEVAGLVRQISPALICDPTIVHYRKTTGRIDALPEVEFVGRSPRPDNRRTAARDLRIRMESGRLVLYSSALGEIALTRPPMESWDGEIESIFSAFTGARLVSVDQTIRGFELVDHLPRLTIGRTVVSREWWQLPAPRGGKWANLAGRNQVTGWRLKEHLGLPDQVFAKFVEEAKPLFVDFHSPLLVDLFVRGWQRTAGPAWVSEMLPGPDELWLQDSRGRYSAELRFGFYRKAGTER